MTKATTFRFGQVVLEMATDGTGTTFAMVCGILKRQISLKKDVSKFEVPDCGNPDAPIWTETEVKSLSAALKMSGLASKEALPTLNALFASNESRLFRFRIIGAGTGTGTPDLMFAGNYHLTDLSLDSNHGEKLQVDLAAESDGEVTVSSVAALP